MEGEAGLGGVAVKHHANGLLGETTTESVVEEEGVGGRGLEPECSVVQESRQRVLIRDLQEALAGSLAENADPALGEVHVLESEVADLSDSRSGGEEGLNDGYVTN